MFFSIEPGTPDRQGRQGRQGKPGRRGAVVRNLPWICAAAVAVFAFIMSSQAGDESHTLSGRLASWLARALKGEFWWMSDSQWRAVTSFLSFALRKGAHILTFYLFTLFILLGLRAKTSKKALIFAAAVFAALLMACADELHQTLSDGRNASSADVLVDMAGAGAACVTVLLALLIRKCYRRLASTWR